MSATARTFAIGALTACSACVGAQDYPSRPIRLIVPHAAGGANDILARIIAPRMAETLGQSLVVDNRGGAGAMIGTSLAAKAAPDGYTLLLADAPHGANPALHSKMPYDTLRDFAPISLISLMPSVLIVHPAVPVTTVGELIALAKAKPGTLNYGTAGVGSSIFLTMALFISRTGIRMFHVSYKSGAPALIDLIAGQTQTQFVNVPPALQHIKAGRIRPLGATSLKRLPTLPQMPTISEAGIADFEDYQWQGVIAPAGIPSVVAWKLNAAIAKVMNEPDIRERLAGMSAEVAVGSPERLAEFIKTQVDRWQKVIAPDMRID